MKSILFGDLFENNSTKKMLNFALMFILFVIMSITISIEGLPFWAYILGIGVPVAIWSWVKPHKVFDGCKFLDE